MIEYSLNLTNRETLSFTVYEKGCEPNSTGPFIKGVPIPSLLYEVPFGASIRDVILFPLMKPQQK